jgi:hypothetical protein
MVARTRPDADVTPGEIVDDVCGTLMWNVERVLKLERSRSNAIAVTKMEEAIFWLQHGKNAREQRIAAEREHEEATGQT